MTDAPAPIGQGQASLGCDKGTGRVAETVFDEFGEFCRRQHGDRAGTSRKAGPGFGRFCMAAKPAQHVCPIDGDTFSGPRRIDGSGTRRSALSRRQWPATTKVG